MTVVIAIHCIVVEIDTKVLRQGEFKLKGKKPEEVAFTFWKQIKRESSLELQLQKVLCEGEEITGLVRKLEEL
ncbi:hypothetical protein [Peribacillus sp. YIM B13477]|uniref:hypothetical protein n=1 Tax=Peribacillus sp. YIM B13477 TaxID=3366300 RepID=UPI0036701269